MLNKSNWVLNFNLNSWIVEPSTTAYKRRFIIWQLLFKFVMFCEVKYFKLNGTDFLNYEI